VKFEAGVGSIASDVYGVKKVIQYRHFTRYDDGFREEITPPPPKVWIIYHIFCRLSEFVIHPKLF
jgi:hypothetical protein